MRRYLESSEYLAGDVTCGGIDSDGRFIMKNAVVVVTLGKKNSCGECLICHSLGALSCRVRFFSVRFHQKN